MTSKKSSLDVFKFTLKDTAKGNILISMIVFIPAMFLVFGEFFLNEVFDTNNPFVPFTGSYVYQVPDMNAGYFAIMILWSCLFAMKTFSFLSSKKECNVYLSLGISRNKLFYSKYLGGAVGIFGTLTVFYAFDLLFNWLVNGWMIEGFTVWAFYYISTLVTCLAAYTVAVYAFVNAGNIVEGIIFTFFFGIFWPIFTAVTNSAFSTMVHGYAYGTQMYSRVNFFSSDIWYLDIFGSYTEQLDKYYDNFTKLYLSADGFDAPNWSGVIFAAVVVIIVTYIAGRMFRNRTSEICGFVFRSKNLYKTFFMLLGIVMGLSLMPAIPKHRVSAAIISSLIAIIFVFVGWLICDRKVPVKATVALAVMSIVFVGGCLIGYGDKVPEKSEVRSIDIKADFSYLSDADPCGYGIGSNFEPDVSYIAPTAVTATSNLSSDNYYTTLTTEKDIDWMLDIHSDLIKDGYRFGSDENTANENITIAYLLNDGSTVVRHYDNISLETYKKLLGFSDTDNGKSLLSLALTGNYSTEDKLLSRPSAMDGQPYSDYHYFGMFGFGYWMEEIKDTLSMDPTNSYYSYGEPTLSAALTDKDFSYVGMLESTNLFLAGEANLLDNEFFGALLTDIDNQTVEQRYFHSPEDEIGAVIVPKVRCYIGSYYRLLNEYEKLKPTEKEEKYNGSFASYYDDIIYSQNEDIYYDSYKVPTVEYYDEEGIGVIYDEAYEKDPAGVIKYTAEKGEISEYFYVYVITKDMTNTIEYLKEAGLYDKLIKSEEKPVSVKLNTTEFVFGHFYNTKDKLKASAINPKFAIYDFERDAEYMVDIFGTPEITDADIITALYDNSLMYSGKVYGGYIAEFFYADGKQVSRFVPASAVTEEIKAKINPGSAG